MTKDTLARNPIYSVHLWEGSVARVWAFWNFDKTMERFREGTGDKDVTEAMAYRHSPISGEAIALLAHHTTKGTVIYGTNENAPPRWRRSVESSEGTRSGVTKTT